MEERLDPEAELIYKQIGYHRYKKLVKNMKGIADKFKERTDKYKSVVGQPLTPSSEVIIDFQKAEKQNLGYSLIFN